MSVGVCVWGGGGGGLEHAPDTPVGIADSHDVLYLLDTLSNKR